MEDGENLTENTSDIANLRSVSLKKVHFIYIQEIWDFVMDIQ